MCGNIRTQASCIYMSYLLREMSIFSSIVFAAPKSMGAQKRTLTCPDEGNNCPGGHSSYAPWITIARGET